MSPDAPQTVELSLEGMTCAACAARIERKLNRIGGVQASVNFPLERASVTYDGARVAPQALVETVAGAGYGARLAQAGPSSETEAAFAGSTPLRRRLAWAIGLSIPVALVSMLPALQFDYWQWAALGLASPVVLWAGWPFHSTAARNLRHGGVTMDTLISIGTLTAWAWSLAVMLLAGAGEPGLRMGFDLVPSRDAGLDHVYFEVAAVVIAFVLLGRVLEERATRSAGEALRALLEAGAKDVSLLDADGRERRVPVDELRVDDRFLVRPGEKVATDGVVVEGHAALDESLLTGESVPVERGPGQEVVGASVSASGSLVVRATRVGADTALGQISRLVAQAQSGKAPVQRLADRVAAVFVPVVLVVAAGTVLFWLASGESAAFAITAMVAVLIIACPCALGLATPTALMVGTGRGAQLGVLIKGPGILESTRRIDTVALDKTGTVTTGRMQVTGLTTVDDVPEAEALRLVGALEVPSEHPIARAIVDAARAEHDVLPSVDGFDPRPGLGVEGRVEGRELLAGQPELLARHGLSMPDRLAPAMREAEARGETPIAAAWDGEMKALFVVSDTPKPTARQAVERLHGLGLGSVLLTGDNEAAARAIAEQVGIDEVRARVLPEGKADAVSDLRRSGRVVAMVGDGINDAPALARADLGIAMGTGTDVAIEASDLTIVSGDPNAIVDAIRLSRRTLSTIRGNLFWAFAYNAVLIPVAAAGLLNPMLAAAAMAFSSVFVVSNSLRLRRFQGVPRTPGHDEPSSATRPADALTPTAA